MAWRKMRPNCSKAIPTQVVAIAVDYVDQIHDDKRAIARRQFGRAAAVGTRFEGLRKTRMTAATFCFAASATARPVPSDSPQSATRSAG